MSKYSVEVRIEHDFDKLDDVFKFIEGLKTESVVYIEIGKSEGG